jgi:putative transposase
VRKTFQDQLRPTSAQERAVDEVRWRCRDLDHAGLEQRKRAWERRRVSLSPYDQEAELQDVRAARPEYAAIHSPVRQDGLARGDRPETAFFRRVQAGEKAGSPRFQGRRRSHACTFQEDGHGARGDHGVLVLSKIGRLTGHWSRPMEGPPKTITVSREADGWDVTIACADIPVKPLPRTGRETGSDVGWQAVLVTADGVFVEHPRSHRQAERHLATCPHRVARRQKGSHRRGKAVHLLAKAAQTVRRQRQEFHHQTALALGRAYDTLAVADLQVANMARRPAPGPDGLGGYLPNGAAATAGWHTSMQDAGWDGFRLIRTCKAASAGKGVVAVPPA